MNALMLLYSIVVAFSLVHLVATRGRAGAARFLAVSVGIATAAELWAQCYGLFGVHYSYDPSRWPVPLVGALPLLVPFMWFGIAYLAYELASALGVRLHALSAPVRALVLAFAAGSAMTLWDLLLDPISVRQGLWAWEGGPYPFHSVPLENFASWLIGGTGLQLALRLVDRGGEAERNRLPLLVFSLCGFAYLLVANDSGLSWIAAGMASLPVGVLVWGEGALRSRGALLRDGA